MAGPVRLAVQYIVVYAMNPYWLTMPCGARAIFVNRLMGGV